MKRYEIKTRFYFVICIKIFVENVMYYDAIHDFSVWQNINQFQSHTGNVVPRRKGRSNIKLKKLENLSSEN